MTAQRKIRCQPTRRNILRRRGILPRLASLKLSRADLRGGFFCAAWLLTLPLYSIVFGLLYWLGFRDFDSPVMDIAKWSITIGLFALIYYGFQRWERQGALAILRQTRQILVKEGLLLEFLQKSEATVGATAPRLNSLAVLPLGAPRHSRQMLAGLADETASRIFRRVPGSRLWHMLGGDVKAQVRRAVEGEFLFLTHRDPLHPPTPQGSRPGSIFLPHIVKGGMFLCRCCSSWPLLRLRRSREITIGVHVQLESDFSQLPTAEAVDTRNTGRIRTSRRESDQGPMERELQ